MFLANKSPWSYIGLYQKFLYKILSLLLTPPPRTFSSHLSRCDNVCIWVKEQIFLCSSRSCAHIQLSVHIFHMRFWRSDWGGHCVMHPPPYRHEEGWKPRHWEVLDAPPGRPQIRSDDGRTRSHPPVFCCFMVIHSGRAEGDPTYPSHMRVNLAW